MKSFTLARVFNHIFTLSLSCHLITCLRESWVCMCFFFSEKTMFIHFYWNDRELLLSSRSNFKRIDNSIWWNLCCFCVCYPRTWKIKIDTFDAKKGGCIHSVCDVAFAFHSRRHNKVIFGCVQWKLNKQMPSLCFALYVYVLFFIHMILTTHVCVCVKYDFFRFFFFSLFPASFTYIVLKHQYFSVNTNQSWNLFDFVGMLFKQAQINGIHFYWAFCENEKLRRLT